MSKKVGAKLYLDKDVLTAAKERVSLMFDDFENIVCSFSGGKDSQVMVELALEEAEKRGRKLNLFFLDQEAEYQATIDLMEKYMSKDSVNPYWFQVPYYMTNSTSFKDEMLYAWGEGEEWIREKHELAIHTLDAEYPQRFYAFIEWFEKQWAPDTTCFLVGLRAEESLNRFRAVVKNPGYKKYYWTTGGKDSPIKAYPLYDWTFEDIWIYISNRNIEYNKVYDYLYALGNDIANLRVSNLVHEKSFSCLTTLQSFEPDTYNKLLKRLNGIHVAARYAEENSVFKTRERPEAFKTWKEYRDFLLETTPLKNKDRFIKRFQNQPDAEITYKGQCRQLLLNDWENNLPVATKKDVEKRKRKKENFIKKWKEIL